MDEVLVVPHGMYSPLERKLIQSVKNARVLYLEPLKGGGMNWLPPHMTIQQHSTFTNYYDFVFMAANAVQKEQKGSMVLLIPNKKIAGDEWNHLIPIYTNTPNIIKDLRSRGLKFGYVGP